LFFLFLFRLCTRRRTDLFIFSNAQASAEEGGRLVRACAEASARHLSSTQFTRAQRRVSDDDGKSALQDGYASLAESAIVLLQSVGVKDDTPGKSPSSKSANKAEASGQSLLSALDGLLSSGPFLRALTPLLGHKEGRVRRKALTLVTERLQNASAESDAGDDAETEAGVALIRELSALIQSKSATTAQAALMALEASALRFATAQSATKPLLSVVPAIVAQLGSASSTLCASAALSLATLAKVLGVRMVSVVNTAMPALLTATTTNAEKLHTGDDGESALVVHSCLAAIRTFVANMAGFVSPFLSELLKVSLHPAVVPSIEDDEQGDGKGGMRAVHDLALAMREELPVLIELRLLIRPLVESWETCLAYDGANGAASCAALLEIIAAAGDSEKATNAHRQQLFSLVLRALDIRRNAPVGAPEAALDAVEGKAVVACVALALKCTESEFLPFFLQCVEWARARSGEADVTRTRLAALFRLAASLADELRAVFVPFFRHLLDLAAAALDVNADPTSGKKKRKSVNADALVMDDIWRMRKWTLAALRRCFQFDNVGFMDSNRYNMLYPLVVEQLTAAPKMDVENDKYDQLTAEGTFGYEVVSACSSLLVAAPDDAHWKPLHRAILMAGRDKKIQTRFFCVRTIEQVVDKLQEEYLTLLPEAIPFLAELTEDMDEYIELATRKLTKRLSELSGEDLKTLMTDGFNPQPKKSEDDDDDDDDSD
jgi:U3 small nucleolar RNA-associated protein 10